MKQLTIIGLLICALTSCSNPQRHESMQELAGGKIVGKWQEDRPTGWFLEVTNDSERGYVRVSRRAWDQANVGMDWPFKVEGFKLKLGTDSKIDFNLNKKK